MTFPSLLVWCYGDHTGGELKRWDACGSHSCVWPEGSSGRCSIFLLPRLWGGGSHGEVSCAPNISCLVERRFLMTIRLLSRDEHMDECWIQCFPFSFNIAVHTHQMAWWLLAWQTDRQTPNAFTQCPSGSDTTVSEDSPPRKSLEFIIQ